MTTTADNAAAAHQMLTITGTGIDGERVEESIALPRLTPEQEAAAARANGILSKIWRGAYRTRRRQAKAERRYFRVAGKGGGVMSERAFAHVSKIEVLADAAGTDGSMFSIGYALGDAV